MSARAANARPHKKARDNRSAAPRSAKDICAQLEADVHSLVGGLYCSSPQMFGDVVQLVRAAAEEMRDAGVEAETCIEALSGISLPCLGVLAESGFEKEIAKAAKATIRCEGDVVVIIEGVGEIGLEDIGASWEKFDPYEAVKAAGLIKKATFLSMTASEYDISSEVPRPADGDESLSSNIQGVRGGYHKRIGEPKFMEAMGHSFEGHDGEVFELDDCNVVVIRLYETRED